jgi:hypothetical protein
MRRQLTAEPDSELATDAISMDVEDDTEGAPATVDGGMADDDDAVNNIGTLCVFRPTYPRHERVKKKVYRTVRTTSRHKQINRRNANALTHRTLTGPQDRRI